MSKLDIVKAALFTPGPRGRWGLPLILWGEPGIGKTFQIRSLADSYNMDIEELTPGARGEGAFGVVPVPDGTSLAYPPPDWAVRISSKAAIVFVDEVTTAPPAVQPALLGLAQFGAIGSTYLGNRVRIIMAANPPEIAAAGYELPPTVANRSGHINWTKPEVQDWLNYMSAIGNEPETKLSADAEESRVMHAWGDKYPQALGEWSGFLYRRPEFLHLMPKKDDPKISRAWPSPRTNELAVRALAGVYIHNLDESDRDEFVGAFVSDGVAIEFSTWKREADLPMPIDVLNGKVEFKHNAKRLDRTVAVLSACSTFFVGKRDEETKKKETHLDNMLELMHSICQAGVPDLVITSAETLARANMGLSKHKTGKKVLEKLGPLLKLSHRL